MGCDPEEMREILSSLRGNLEGRDITATVDERGRLTIKEDDRKALGINGQRALLDLRVKVLEVGVGPKRSDGAGIQ